MLFLTVDGLQHEIKVHCDGKLSMRCRTTHLEQEKLVMYFMYRMYNKLQQASACVDAATLLATPQQQQCPVVGLRMCWCKVGT